MALPSIPGPLRFLATGPDLPRIPDREEQDRRYRTHRLRVMLAITLGYGLAYTLRLGLAVVKKPLIDQGLFDAAQLGVIGSAIFYGYAFGKLVNGFLADHANIKRFFPLGVALSAAINLTMGSVTLLWMWVVLWGLNGWFQGFGAPSGVVSLTHWFSTRERGRYYGIWSTAHSLGEGLTFVGSAALVAWLGWRGGFMGPGAICLAVVPCMYLLLQDRPPTLGLPPVNEWKGEPVPAASQQSAGSTTRAQLGIFKLPTIWVLGLASATMYVTRYAVNSWGVFYLQEARGCSLLEAGSIVGTGTVSGIVGCVAYGFLSDKVFAARRPPANLIFGAVELLALYLIFYAQIESRLLLAAAFVLYGFGLNGLVTALGGLFAVDLVPRRATGAAMGFIGIFSYVGAALQEQISGHLIERGTTMVNGARVYDFGAVKLLWVGASVLSFVLAASLWRARTRS